MNNALLIAFIFHQTTKREKEKMDPRMRAFDALNSERAYQDAIAARYQHTGTPSFEAELLLIDEFTRLAKEAWRTQKGNAAALEQLRKLGGCLVRCFENYGVENRPSPTADA
jgi:hypothetical protein